MEEIKGYSIIKRPLNRTRYTSGGKDERGISYGMFVSHWTTKENLSWEMKHGIVSQPCPFCDHGTSLLTAELQYFSGDEQIYVSYKCNNCSESFTTTEIDTINFAPLSEKRRRRKLIISVVIELLKIKYKQKK